MMAGAAAFGLIAAMAFGALWLAERRRLHASLIAFASLESSLTGCKAAARQAIGEAAQLREMQDALPVPVWRRDQSGVLLACNRAYAETLGKIPETTPPLASRGDAAASAAPVRTHAVIGGRRRLLDLHEAPCSEGGTAGFALDCTDVESARAELRRHIGAHAAVLETVSAAIGVFGPDKQLTFFNSAFAGLWQLDPAWLALRPTLDDILERLHAARRLTEFADFRAFKRERGAMFSSLIEPRHELVHLPDGRTLQLTVSPHPLGGLTFVYDDVSDRLALECSYNTLAAVQHATLDHLFEGIAVYGGDGRLKLHNPAFRSLWGLSEADVAGEPHIGAITDKTRGLIDDGGDWRLVREEMVARVTSQTLSSGPLYRRDGSILQMASVPLPDGEVLLTYIDVTDSARVERALRERNEALETAERLRSEFIANVSHDLRTPLNTVIGFAEILHNQYFGSLNPSQREYSRGILDSGHQLMALINDIVDLAAIEAGDLELERGRVEVAEMLDAVMSLTRERARSRGLAMELHCPPQIGAIDGDERRLKQALFNLISNAIRFTPPGGAIRLEAERRGRELLLSVGDTGAGIAATANAAETSAAAAAPCARGPRQLNCSLGLSLVKSQIELHGGAVAIDTSPGRGTRIICRLPACDASRGGRAIGNPPSNRDADSLSEIAA